MPGKNYNQVPLKYTDRPSSGEGVSYTYPRGKNRNRFHTAPEHSATDRNPKGILRVGVDGDDGDGDDDRHFIC